MMSIITIHDSLTTFGGSREVFCCGKCRLRRHFPQQKRSELPQAARRLVIIVLPNVLFRRKKKRAAAGGEESDT